MRMCVCMCVGMCGGVRNMYVVPKIVVVGRHAHLGVLVQLLRRIIKQMLKAIKHQSAIKQALRNIKTLSLNDLTAFHLNIPELGYASHKKRAWAFGQLLSRLDSTLDEIGLLFFIIEHALHVLFHHVSLFLSNSSTSTNTNTSSSRTPTLLSSNVNEFRTQSARYINPMLEQLRNIESYYGHHVLHLKKRNRMHDDTKHTHDAHEHIHTHTYIKHNTHTPVWPMLIM